MDDDPKQPPRTAWYDALPGCLGCLWFLILAFVLLAVLVWAWRTIFGG